MHLAKHRANNGGKALTMLAGGDSIDDSAVLWAGAASELFDATRAPSTIGTWLRAHKGSNARQHDAISRELVDTLTARLIVRRVRPTPGSQLALFTDWDYHAFVTNRPGEVLEVDANHRRHAVVEQGIAGLQSAGLRSCHPATSWPTPPGSP